MRDTLVLKEIRAQDKINILVGEISGSQSSKKMTVIWDVTSCSMVKYDRRFRSAVYTITHSPTDGSSNNLWNVGFILPDYTAHPKRQSSAHKQFRKYKIKTLSQNVRIYQSININTYTSTRIPKVKIKDVVSKLLRNTEVCVSRLANGSEQKSPDSRVQV